jgi:hypothetical protein
VVEVDLPLNLLKKFRSIFEIAVEETEITIPYEKPYLLQVVRRNVSILSNDADESGLVLRISGTPKQIEKLKAIIGDKL